MQEITKIVTTVPPEKLKLDHQIKKVLAQKPILARILKGTVEECRWMSAEEIEQCIEGEPMVEAILLEPGLTNNPQAIRGENTESAEEGEGLVTFDIRTAINIPEGEKRVIKILLNIEAQKDDHPGYPLEYRGIYYGARLISSQLNVEFTNRAEDPVKYGNMKKVYSIWICTEAAQKRANRIKKLSLKPEMLLGEPFGEGIDTGLLNVIILTISRTFNLDGCDDPVICMLTDILSTAIGSNEKIKRLGSKYGIPISEGLEKEVDRMTVFVSNLVEDTAKKNYDKGNQDGQKTGEKNGVKLGEDKMGRLVKRLSEAGRQEDILKVVDEPEYREKLYKEFSIETTP